MNVRLLLLTLLLIATALPAQTVVQPALPAANDGDEEVQKPIPFTDQELRVLRSLNSPARAAARLRQAGQHSHA